MVYAAASGPYGIINLMIYAVLADIHANLEALAAVLADIDRRGGTDEYLVLGDMVGYGPDPGSCIKRISELPARVVAGNHDAAAVRAGDAFNFNPQAAAAVNWTAARLTAAELNYLAGLPDILATAGFTLSHGSPRQPTVEYIFSPVEARPNFKLLGTPHALVGHTHVPAVFKQTDDGTVSEVRVSPDTAVVIDGGRFIINPGSVGQPRDGDPRAAYAIYDSDTARLQFYRVAYDIAAVQEKMRSYNLPVSLVSRLEKGL